LTFSGGLNICSLKITNDPKKDGKFDELKLSKPDYSVAEEIVSEAVDRIFWWRDADHLNEVSRVIAEALNNYCLTEETPASRLSPNDISTIAEPLRQKVNEYPEDFEAALSWVCRREAASAGGEQECSFDFPKLTVNVSIDHDQKVMATWLHSETSPMREFLLTELPDLRAKLEGVEAGSPQQWEITLKYLTEAYQKEAARVEEVVLQIEDALKDWSEKIFRVLGEETQHEWTRDEYCVHPTLTPISPYMSGFFSIPLNSLPDDPAEAAHLILKVALHELSHFVWHEKYNIVRRELGFELDNYAEQVLKELYAPVVLGTDAVRNLYDCNERSYFEYQALMVIVDGTSEPIPLMDYLSEQYRAVRDAGGSFNDAMKAAIETTHSIENELLAKRAIWSRLAKPHTRPETKVLAESGYKKPIKVPPV
jgi:hypothetical protein